MTVPTMRPDHHRPTASWLVSGAFAVALLVPSGTAGAAGGVDVDLGALDALPPAATAGAPAVRLRPPGSAKSAPAARPAPAAKPTAKSTLHVVPGPAAEPDATTAEPAATAQRPAIAAPGVAPLPAAPPPAPPPPVASPSVPSPPIAALPPPAPAAAVVPTGRLLFPGGSFDLSIDAKSELDTVAARLTADPHLYLQLMAYAAGGGDGSEARRLSLSRALAARGYLLDHGVDGKQVDVRPLGNRAEPGQPPDRVDCVVVTR